MNYKNALFTLLAVLFIFSSCNKSSELTNAIPMDAYYIAHVDAKSLIAKSQYDVFQNRIIQSAINMGKAFLKEDQIKLIDNFLKDANSVGLDLKNEYYVYSDGRIYGVVIGVNDAEKLKQTLISSTMVREDNISKEKDVYCVSPESSTCIVWNKEKLLLLVDLNGYASDSRDIINLAKAQLVQPADKSINSNKQFQAFQKEKKDISTFYSIEGVSQFAKANIPGLDYTPYLQDLKGVSYASFVNFEKGEILNNTKFFYDSAESEERFNAFSKEFIGELKGDQLKYISDNPLLLASINLKGGTVASYIEKMGVFDVLTSDIDSATSQKLNSILNHVNGDVTFAITKVENIVSQDEFTSTDLVPQCLLLVDVDNSKLVLDLLKEHLENSDQAINEITPSTFSKSIDQDINIYFGVMNDLFFITNIESVYKNLESKDLTNKYADQIKGKTMFISGDLQVLDKDLLEQQALVATRSISLIIPFSNLFTKYQMSFSSDNLDGKGDIQLKNREDNSLKTICKQIDDLINKSASQFFY